MTVDPNLTNARSSGALAPVPEREPWEPEDEAADIRFSLTALGEALVNERRGRPFRGFGPCAPAGRSSGKGAERGLAALTQRVRT